MIRVTVDDLAEIDLILEQAMDALESDADKTQREEAFDAIRTLYDEGTLLGRMITAIQANPGRSNEEITEKGF